MLAVFRRYFRRANTRLRPAAASFDTVCNIFLLTDIGRLSNSYVSFKFPTSLTIKLQFPQSWPSPHKMWLWNLWLNSLHITAVFLCLFQFLIVYSQIFYFDKFIHIPCSHHSLHYFYFVIHKIYIWDIIKTTLWILLKAFCVKIIVRQNVKQPFSLVMQVMKFLFRSRHPEACRSLLFNKVAA